jgi:predicted nuclease of predicted toxin-antitoxin system
MRRQFKLDENVGRRLQRIFHDRGHDAVTVRDQKLRGASHPRVLSAASAEGRILVTMDQDFVNVLLFPPATTAGVAVTRFPGRATARLLESLVAALLEALEQKRIKGRLWIVEPGRIHEHQNDLDLDLELETDGPESEATMT